MPNAVILLTNRIVPVRSFTVSTEMFPLVTRTTSRGIFLDVETVYAQDKDAALASLLAEYLDARW